MESANLLETPYKRSDWTADSDVPCAFFVMMASVPITGLPPTSFALAGSATALVARAAATFCTKARRLEAAGARATVEATRARKETRDRSIMVFGWCGVSWGLDEWYRFQIVRMKMWNLGTLRLYYGLYITVWMTHSHSDEMELHKTIVADFRRQIIIVTSAELCIQYAWE